MNWEQKIEMCQHLNNERYSEAVKLVIDNIETIDEQGWDMYFNGIEVTKESIAPLIESHLIIYHKIKNLQTSNVRVGIRMAAYEMIIEDLTQQIP